MKEPNEPRPSDSLKLEEGFDAAYTSAVIVSACFTPFLRGDIGHRCYGWSGPAALAGMAVYAGLAPCPLLFPYIAAWLVALIFRRFTADRSRHSLDSGDPTTIRALLPRCPYGLAVVLEAALLLGIGVALRAISGPLGMFFIAGAGSLVFVYLSESAAMRAKARRIDDMAKEQEAVAHYIRRRRR